MRSPFPRIEIPVTLLPFTKGKNCFKLTVTLPLFHGVNELSGNQPKNSRTLRCRLGHNSEKQNERPRKDSNEKFYQLGLTRWEARTPLTPRPLWGRPACAPKRSGKGVGKGLREKHKTFGEGSEGEQRHNQLLIKRNGAQ